MNDFNLDSLEDREKEKRNSLAIEQLYHEVLDLCSDVNFLCSKPLICPHCKKGVDISPSEYEW